MIIDNDTERTERRQEATARVESLLDEAEDLITSIKIELLREHQELCERLIRELRPEDEDITRLF